MLRSSFGMQGGWQSEEQLAEGILALCLSNVTLAVLTRRTLSAEEADLAFNAIVKLV